MSSYDEARDAAYAENGEMDGSNLTREGVDRLIDAFLGKLSETHAVVPREPTEAMCEAGRKVEDALPTDTEARQYCARVYRAMLAQEVKP